MTDTNEHLFKGLTLYGTPTDVEDAEFDDGSTDDITPLDPTQILDGNQENGGLATLSEDELKKFYEIVYGASGASEAKLKAYFGSSSRNWDQLCQAGVWNACHHFGTAPTPYASANAARAASKIVGTTASKAVGGDWYFWSIGSYGHVGGALGGGRVWMCSRHVDSKWGVNVGVTTVARYTALTGARFLGYAHGDGRNDYAFSKPSKPATTDQAHVKKLTKWLNGQSLGLNSTASIDGKRGKVYWLMIQTWGSRHDDTGKAVARAKSFYPSGFDLDGDPGSANSRTRKIQSWLIQHHG